MRAVGIDLFSGHPDILTADCVFKRVREVSGLKNQRDETNDPDTPQIKYSPAVTGDVSGCPDKIPDALLIHARKPDTRYANDLRSYRAVRGAKLLRPSQSRYALEE
jgi:hypothetical protein